MSIPYALLFPGQGSQAAGMLNELAKKYSLVQDYFAQASSILSYDLWQLTQENPDDKLNQTQYTQPALLVAEVAIWQCWNKENGLMPQVMAGHSLGEYSALVCSGALQFSDAVKLVALRGQFMQEACAPGVGAMAAIIGLDEQAVKDLCHSVVKTNEILSPANYNSLGQTVIAGHADAVDRAVIEAKKRGAKLAKRIEVSVPSHCELMQPAAKRLADEIDKIKIDISTIPVIQNYDVKIHKNSEDIREALIAQLTHPVRWVETVQAIHQQFAIDVMVECGPGKVIGALNKRILNSVTTYDVNNPIHLQNTIQLIQGAKVCL